MRATILILATASAVAFAAAPAHAQSDRDAFTGPRVEATVGYDVTDANLGVAGADDSLEGVRVGAAVGYDLPIGDTFTIGAEAGIGFDLAGKNEYASGNTAYRVTSGYDLDLSLRLGAKVTPSTLLYVKGGWANSEYRVRTTVGGVSGNSVTKVSDDNDGYRLGAGVEQAFGEHLYAKAEYRFTGYGDDVNRHQVLVGAGYRF